MRITLIALALFGATPAFGAVNSTVSTGIRGADFAIAPTTKGITMTELEVRAGSDTLVQLPASVGISAGMAFAYSSMRGNLGRGLDSFSGVSYGPEVKAEMTVTPRIKPFATVGYRLGRYTGHGKANWSDEEVPAFFLYTASNDAREKHFASAGAHMSVGAAAQIWGMVSASAAVDLGFERMSSDTRVVSGASELTNRTDGDFLSRALLVGARVDI